MKTQGIKYFYFFTTAFLTLIIFQTSVFSLGWGFEVGRANETDVESLLADQLALRDAFRRLDNIQRNILGKERQRILLAREEKENAMENLQKATDKWWKDKIDEPMRRIVKNPAASCAEAEEVIKVLFGRTRQRELLGLENELNVNGEIFNDFRNRCHEEALDECNMTGRWDQFLDTYLTEERQAALIGMAVDEKWVLPMLEECAIYELHYVSDTTIYDGLKLHSIIDGRIKLKPKTEGKTPIEALQKMEFEGEVESANNPFLQKLECSELHKRVVCSVGGPPLKSASASIKKLGIKSKEFYVENGVSKQKPVGEDQLTVEFSPAMLYGVVNTWIEETQQITTPLLEIGATGFHIAHQKWEISDLIFKFNEMKRNGYPILFEFKLAEEGADEDIRASDSTVFQIIHKPEKKPFPPRESKPRKPLVPRKPN